VKKTMITCAAALVAIMAGGAINAVAQEQDNDATTTTTVTNATGTITQLNYDENGTINGFVLGTNILLVIPPGCL
jgi:hypothetical protein